MSLLARRIQGAQAAALVVFLARTGVDKAEIRREIESRFRYDLWRTIEQIRPTYAFDVTCQGSVPEAIIAFLATEDLEGAIRAAISLGGDADTLAAIAGAAAGAAQRSVSPRMARETRKRLTAEMLDVLSRFSARYG